MARLLIASDSGLPSFILPTTDTTRKVTRPSLASRTVQTRHCRSRHHLPTPTLLFRSVTHLQPLRTATGPTPVRSRSPPTVRNPPAKHGPILPGLLGRQRGRQTPPKTGPAAASVSDASTASTCFASSACCASDCSSRGPHGPIPGLVAINPRRHDAVTSTTFPAHEHGCPTLGAVGLLPLCVGHV